MWISKPRKILQKSVIGFFEGLCIGLAGKLLPDGLWNELLHVINVQKSFFPS